MSRPLHVLLIEDNDVDAAIFTRSVEQMAGWRVSRVSSLDEAEEIVEARGGAYFDLVAVDLTLPDAVDLEAVQFARRAIPQAVCVAVTARDPGEVDERALRAGATDLLVKGQMNARGIQRAVTHAVERNRLVRRQLESERNLRSVLAAWTDALVVVDDARRVLFRNEAAVALGDAVVEADGDGARLTLEVAPGEVLQTEVPRTGAEPLPVEIRSWPISWADEPARVVVVRDRRPERAAERARTLAEAGQGALKGVHDIGNRVAAMQDVLARVRVAAEGSPLAEALEALDAHCEHIAHVVRASRADASKLRQRRIPVDLCTLVRSSCAALREPIERVAALRLQLDPVVEVRGEPLELARVVDNLVKNAVEALAEAEGSGRELRVAVRHDGDRAVLEVADNGPGMGADVRERIFDEGFTGKAFGTGLGLSNVRRILGEHGGAIRVESAPGQGALFRVTLPALRTRRGLRLLLLEDQPEVARAHERILGERYAIEVVHDGAAALERLATIAAPDVILCDLDMPGIDGRGFFERLLADHPPLAERVVFCSGGATSVDVERFLATAGRPMLQKPLDPAEALSTIDAVADRACVR